MNSRGGEPAYPCEKDAGERTRKPTIAELETMLADNDPGKISILPDGSITVVKRHSGMTIRERFAMAAMQGNCAIPDQRTCPEERMHEVEKWRDEIMAQDARYCVSMADALLTALEAK